MRRRPSCASRSPRGPSPNTDVRRALFVPPRYILVLASSFAACERPSSTSALFVRIAARTEVPCDPFGTVGSLARACLGRYGQPTTGGEGKGFGSKRRQGRSSTDRGPRSCPGCD